MKVIKIKGDIAIFDNPQNPNARWGSVVKIVIDEKPRIVLSHIGSGYLSEIKGVKSITPSEI